MRVLFMAERFWPLIGGVEVISARTLPALRERGHEIVVVTGREHEGMAERDSYEGIPVHRLDLIRPFVERDLEGIAEARAEIAALVAAWRPELVHAIFTGPGLFFVPSPRTVRSIISMHGTWPQLRIEPQGMFGTKLRGASWVTACSYDALAEVVAGVPEVAERSSVIHNGLDPIGEPSPLRFDPPLLWCAGRVVEDKGFEMALRALPAVLERFEGTRMVIAGDGPERERLVGLAAELGLAERVEFPGWVSPEQAMAGVGGATIALVPSRLEGFGLVALEAMLAGRPVVATRVGGLPEVVAEGETGLLVERDDPAALSSAILSLLKDEERTQAMGSAGRRRAVERFSARGHTDEWDRLYRRVGRRMTADVV